MMPLQGVEMESELDLELASASPAAPPLGTTPPQRVSTSFTMRFARFPKPLARS
jgi:hypothetical protein